MNVNSDRAYEHIRKRILSGQYPPGHVLMTEALSDEIGVSRTPVREALQDLRAEGLVTIKPRLGASVKKLNHKEFEELCDLRTAVEGHAAGLAARRWTDAQLREIQGALEGMRVLTERIVANESEDALLGELVREDVRFHIGIISAAQNDLMRQEILRMHLINKVVCRSMTPTAPAEMMANRRAVLASHQEIFDAIARRDAWAAERTMKEHVQEIIAKVLRQMVAAKTFSSARELTSEELIYGT
jgi:DNA-binding GntR family transcriptional regulator